MQKGEEISLMRNEIKTDRKIIIGLIITIILVLIIIIVVVASLLISEKRGNNNATTTEEAAINNGTGGAIVNDSNPYCDNFASEGQRLNCKISESAQAGDESFCSGISSNENFTYYSTLKGRIVKSSAKDYCWLEKTQSTQSNYCTNIEDQDTKDICLDIIK